VTQQPGKPEAPATPEKVVPKPKAQPAPVRPAPSRVSVGERLARLWPAGLVAAAILVGVVTWVILGGGSSTPEKTVVQLPPDPMLEKVVTAKVKLDTASTDTGKLDALSDLAYTIHDEARALHKVTPDEMASLASMYRQVVEDGLVPQARSLGRDERRTQLARYAQRLAETEQEAHRLAEEAPADSIRPLREIEAVAKEGKTQLNRLMQG
jgi:hypothetical protein